MENNHPLEADTFQQVQEILGLLWTRRYITVFTKANYRPLF
jgi:hypothetical protein